MNGAGDEWWQNPLRNNQLETLDFEGYFYELSKERTSLVYRLLAYAFNFDNKLKILCKLLKYNNSLNTLNFRGAVFSLIYW